MQPFTGARESFVKTGATKGGAARRRALLIALKASRHRRRDKVFGDGRAVPLDRNAKARIWACAQAYTARLRRKGQHRGPLTRATLDVLRALLWGFHNQHTGRCFPSYEAIAEAAKVSRATVARAVAVLEAAALMSWENRLVRQRVAVMGLFGREWQSVPRRTSNAYRFHDPQLANRPTLPKSQNSTGTPVGESSPHAPSTIADLDPGNRLDAMLLRLGKSILKREEEDAQEGCSGSSGC